MNKESVNWNQDGYKLTQPAESEELEIEKIEE